MSEQAQLPTVEERQAFGQKLGQFRAELSADQQRMLDAMVMAAFTPQDQADVQGYWWFWGNDPATPQWYSGLIPPGETSRWWQIANTGWA